MRLGEVRVKAAAQLPLVTTTEPRTPASIPVLDERMRGTKFVSLPAKSILNSPQQTGMDFWSINPYVGCEFGCTYCYARYAHRYVVERARDAGRLSDETFTEFRGREGWEAFERRIFVKERLLGALDADLRRYFRTAEPGAPIVIGTATDPYQPGERRFRLTRSILERLASFEGLSIGIITKSPVVARDVDVLQRLARRSHVEVYVSLITVDAELVRKVEMRSPLPAARLRALRKLTTAGINAGLILAPVLPGVTDDLPHLEALFAAARDAGARFVHGGPLRLYGAVRDRFLPVLAEHFPDLVERYRKAYTESNAPSEYAGALKNRLRKLQKRFGFPVNNGMVDRYRSPRPRPQVDLGL